jgi:hypothetical protein
VNFGRRLVEMIEMGAAILIGFTILCFFTIRVPWVDYFD